MVGSRYPFRDRERDPNRRVDDSAGNRRDDSAGNRRDEPVGNRREDGPPGNRPERPRDAAMNNRPRRPERRPDEAPDGGAVPPGVPPSAGLPAAVPPSSAGAAELAALSSEVESLIRLLTATDVNELQLESGGLKILIRRGAPTSVATTAAPLLMVPTPPAAAVPVAAAPPTALPAPAAHLPAMPGHSGNPATPILTAGEHLVTSPMVGTFYASPAPQEAPYVVEGDEVAVGQTVGIVEAMKMMNPIEAEIGGRVARILVRDAQGVEYGQPLIVIAEG